MPVLVGPKLFEGAQANIYRLEAELDDALKPLPVQRFKSTPQQEWVVKVMGSRDCAPTSAAAKLVPPEKRMDSRALQQAFEAAREAAKIRHRNIISMPLVELNPAGDMLTIVMPRKAGTLSEWLRGRLHPQRLLSFPTLISLSEQLMSAVGIGLHHAGVSHLDLSLNNILVDSLEADMPNLFVCDLESATLAGRAPSQAFTEEFSAPERRDNPGPHSDVFSIGVMLLSLGALSSVPGMTYNFPQEGDAQGCFLNYSRVTPTDMSVMISRELRRYPEGFQTLVRFMLNHDWRTRATLAQLLPSIRALREAPGESAAKIYLPFPFSRSPLALEPTGVKNLQLYPQSCMYDLHARCTKCGHRRSVDRQTARVCKATNALHLPGFCSPEFQMGELLTRGDCPPTLASTNARFLHALQPNADIPDSDSSPAEGDLFQTNGGFSLISSKSGSGPKESAGTPSLFPETLLVLHPLREKEMAQRNSLVLNFGSPLPWPSECTISLYREGRVQQAVPSLFSDSAAAAIGVAPSAFCWVLPGERFKLCNDRTWVPSQTGGFLFLFRQSQTAPSALETFFPVEVGTTGPVSRPRSSK